MHRLDEHPDHTFERSMLEAEEQRQREDRRELEARHGPARKECGFCRGRPVQDAASWLDGKPRSPAPCPRCGQANDA